MKGEKFPQAEYAEFIGDGVYFDEKPPQPAPKKEDVKKNTDETVDARERSLGDMNDALLDDTQGKSKLPRTALNSVAPLEPMVPFVKKIPKIPEFQEQFPKEKKPEKKNELGDINDALMDHPAAPASSKKADAIPKGGFRTAPNPVAPSGPKVRFKREDHATTIQKRREEYINDYTKKVADIKGWKKNLARVGHWFGFKNKHTVADAKKSQEAFYKRRDMSLIDRAAELEQTYKTRARNERVGSDGKIIDREQAFKRYQNVMKAIETSREKTRLADMKKDREELHGEREKAWKAEQVEKTKFQKNLSKFLEGKFYKNTVGHENVRKALGNRYVRFALISGTVGVLTGGIGSAGFWATKITRFAGGAIGGGATRKLLDKALNDEKMLQRGIATLDQSFQDKQITGAEYDKKRLTLDAKLNQIKRVKDAAALVAGYEAAGFASDHLAQPLHDGMIKLKDSIVEAMPGSTLMPQGVEYENPPVVHTDPTPVQDPEAILPPQYTYPDAMPVSSLGALDTIEKYKAQLAAFYVDKPIPPVAQHFMDTPTADLAKEIGAWDPNAVNESHTMPKGSTIGLKDGVLSYHNSVTGADTEVLKTLGSRAGEVVVPTSNELDMFDSGKTVASPEATVADQPLTSEQSDTQLSGGRGAPNEDIREVADVPLESQWFTVADENTVATPASATSSLQEIETPPGDAPEMPVEEREVLARKALYDEMMQAESEAQDAPQEEVPAMSTSEPLPIAETNPEPIPLVDESELKVQNQTNIPNEEFSSSETVDTVDESTNNETVAPPKTTPELPAAITEGPFKDSSLDFAFNEKTGQYDLRSMLMVTPEVVQQAIPKVESYLMNGGESLVSDTSPVKDSVISTLERYRFLDGLLRFGGFEPGSPYHDAIVRAAENLQDVFEKNYAGGGDVLKNLTVPQPVR